MRWAFSNIAWSPHDNPAVFDLLRAHGVEGIEVAPTKLWPNWHGASPHSALLARRTLHDQGFCVPSLQAVLYAQPAARLFDAAGEAALLHHMRLVARLAEAFGATAVVWGAPRQRDRGGLTPQQAFVHAVPICRQLAQIFADHDSTLCIEPVARRDHGNFIVTAAAGAELVRAVDHPGFALHLDAAALYAEGDSIASVWPEVGRWVRHVHISEPGLASFAAPQVPHTINLQALTAAGYTGWCAVEMREPAEPLAQVGPWPWLPKSRHA